MGDIVDYNNPLGQGGEVKAYLMTISELLNLIKPTQRISRSLVSTTIPSGHIFQTVDSSCGVLCKARDLNNNPGDNRGVGYDSVILGAELAGEGLDW